MITAANGGYRPGSRKNAVTLAANVLDQDPVAAGYQPMVWRFRTH